MQPVTLDLADLAARALAGPDGGSVLVDNGDLDPRVRNALAGDDPEALLAFAAGPPVVIENPFAAQPPKVNLLAAAVDVTGILQAVYGQHWIGGFQFEPEGAALNLVTEYPYFWQCSEGAGLTWAHLAEVATGSGKKPVPAKPTLVGARPYVASTADPCISTFGMFGRDAEGRATRLLEANLSRIIANELWTGARSTANGFFSAGPPITNDYLTRNPTAVNGGVLTGHLNALAELEQAYYALDNRPGFIHAEPRLVQLWNRASFINPAPSGRYLISGLGSIVVADAGYDGSGAGVAAGTHAQSWAYMTGPIGYARTPTKLQVTDEAQRVDIHGTQDRVVRAECDVIAFWDSKVNVSVLADHLHELA